MYVVRVARDAPFTRDALVEALRALGIGATVHYLPIHRQPHWRERWGGLAGRLPVTEDAARRVLTLPLSPAFEEAEIERACELVLDVCDQLAGRPKSVPRLYL
jgi:dTDP-4-amino-4,6-dideoxygalactose transaminase